MSEKKQDGEKRLVGDVAAERAVLAGLAQHGQNAYFDISDIITVNSFSNDSNKLIFRVLQRALETNKNADMPTFISAASELGLYEAVSDRREAEFIRSIFSLPILLDNVRPQAMKVKKLEIIRLAMRNTIQTYRDLEQCTGKESLDHILSLVDGSSNKLADQINSTQEDAPTTLDEDIDEYIKHLEENSSDVVGIPTGFPRWDESIGGGPRRGGVTLVGARPKTGKTTLGKAIAYNVSSGENIRAKMPVLFLDTEMNKRDQINRNLASLARVKTRMVETGKFKLLSKDREKVYKAKEKLKGLPYYYKNVSGKPFEEILSIMRRWINTVVGRDENGNTKDCLIIYDYFKLMDSGDLDKMQEFQVLGFQITKLHDFLVKYDCPCIAFVQLNRDGVTKETSDIISQSDRLLWLCTSFSMFKKKTAEELVDDGDENGNMKLVPLESRFGGGLQFGDYINLYMNGDMSEILEGKTKHELLKSGAIDTGFQLDESEPDLD